VSAAATASPGFWDWSFDPALGLTIVLGLLYKMGDERTVTPAAKRAAQRFRNACFYSSLIVLVVALESPIDALSQRLFWVHMIQHILLLMVAAPLFVIACPWIRIWRCLPLRTRMRLARGLAHGRRTTPLRSISRTLGRPAPSFIAFSVVLLGWHVPALFDATLHSTALHALEHTLFFVTALMLWKQLILSPPLHTRLLAVQRVLYAVGAMIVSWALAVVLALAPHPLYASYAHLSSRPGGISAIADQQLAAGVMWVPGSITFLIVVFAYLHRWLVATPAPAPPARLAGEG
jgi:putative membrane protein